MGILIGLDHGGSTTTALALGEDGRILGRRSMAMPRQSPRPGWVEHYAEDFLTTSLGVIRGVLESAGLRPRDVEAIGVANQGETTIAWNASTGRPVGPALSWQDRRTAADCAGLVAAGHESTVRALTGLPIDPYFSATKIRWLLRESEPAQQALAEGTLRVGGSDAFVLFRLTHGEVHATDPSTASRTGLMNLAGLRWDPEVATRVFGVPVEALPEIRPTTGRHFGEIHAGEDLGRVPFTADVVDANAALLVQGGRDPRIVKATYGTGAFIAATVGERPVIPDNGLLPFAAWQIDGTTSYAVEGGVFDVGTAMGWLVDLGLLDSPAASAEVARTASDGQGVVMVPSFRGLAAPRWRPEARAAVLGLTLDTRPGDLVRAVLEGVACSVAEIVLALQEATGLAPAEVRADGGPSQNAFLMQLQADLLGRPVSVSREPELTAFGAAVMAGIGTGAVSMSDVAALAPPRDSYEPQLTDDERAERLGAWRAAADAVADYGSPRNRHRPARPE